MNLLSLLVPGLLMGGGSAAAPANTNIVCQTIVASNTASYIIAGNTSTVAVASNTSITIIANDC